MSTLSQIMAGMYHLLAVLDAVDAQPQALELRARSYELLGDLTGRTVVDAGCGSGRAVAELAERGAHAIGVDLDPDMIAAARKRWPAGEFHVGDAYELPLETGSVSGYRADKVLHTLDDPARAVAEARRVLAPGGRVVLLGQDWDTIVIDSDEPQATRRLIHAKADLLPSPRVARRYRNLLLDAGFVDPVVEVHTSVFTDDTALGLLHRITDEEGWLAEQAERARTNRIFVAVPMFLVAAQG
ncbi:methyltransferase domain-containing protein [Micromonospora sp. URMC 106]|uniref:methyltransferase domain-containing protein n=1 Tax=Micromonospora sp. URMC 106 TaxID=3423408 RepID=UPI003F1C29DD